MKKNTIALLFFHLACFMFHADNSNGFDTVNITGRGCTYIYHARKRELHVRIDDKTFPFLQGVGPVWKVADKEINATMECVRLAGTEMQDEDFVFYYEAPGDIKWSLTLRKGADNDLIFELKSDQKCFLKAQPGQVISGGKWTGLDLNQYQMAHGQTNWPKTYYLQQYDLFLCAWWDWEISNASTPQWPLNECESRSGDKPFAPAASMIYQPCLDGSTASLCDALHVRVSPKLWDAALPSLCEPSEYRYVLSGMVYLDIWGGETAVEMKHLLSCLSKLTGEHVRFLTIVQNWQAAGFDALLPDSIWMPEYPPNPALGTVDEYRELSELGKKLGLFGFRTNYALLCDQAPSVLKGIVSQALDETGKAKWHTQPSKWATLAGRQEREIAELWHPNASFTDQLASGGGPQIYVDYNRKAGGDETMSTTLRQQRELARMIKSKHNGPLGSETLNQQDLIGKYCDFGDYGCMNGHNRYFPPDYKLQRLQNLTMHYGCGLAYRFFEAPPFKLFHKQALDIWGDPALMDDYRCCEVMLGNGAYIFWKSPWVWTLTESILVGRLQNYYALQPVSSVDYMSDGKWISLEDLVRKGFTPQGRPWLQKQKKLGRVRVIYRNGLTVFINRLTENLTVDIPDGQLTLPQYGWVAFMPDNSLLAYSALKPGTDQRIDFLEEHSTKLRFLNPRNQKCEGSEEVRLWQDKKLIWSFNPETDIVMAGDEKISLSSIPVPMTAEQIDFDFRQGLSGCRAIHGILRVEPTDVGQRLINLSPDPYLFLPPLEFTGNRNDVIEVTFSADAGTMGQLYFSTSEGGLHMKSFTVNPDGEMHTISIPVGQHDRWQGADITRLRLDPVHGPAKSSVVLQSLRLKRK